MDIIPIEDSSAYDVDWIVVPVLVVGIDVEGIEHESAASSNQEERQNDIDLNERYYIIPEHHKMEIMDIQSA